MEFKKEKEILQEVVSKALNNPAFKQELIANPQEAIKKMTGESLNLPGGKTLAVCDQSDPGVLYLNLPEKPDFDNVELTEEQLEVVAGGNKIEEWIAKKIVDLILPHLI